MYANGCGEQVWQLGRLGLVSNLVALKETVSSAVYRIVPGDV